MEAKKLFIAVVLIALIVAFGFISFNNKKEVEIKAQLYDVAKQINDLNNWKKWYPDLHNNSKISGDFTTDQLAILSSGKQLLLHHINPLTVSLTKKTNGNTSTSLVTISPEANDSSINIAWHENVSVYKIIERSFTKSNSRIIALNNLKKLMEDINYKYGFFINIVPVKDTLILTAEGSLNDFYNTTSELYHTLHSFITQNKLPYETKYFYKTALDNNKIAVGIPVYEKMHNADGIKFLELPANGRLVEGIYSGNIADKQSIYTSINTFMLDQHLKQVAKPLEQYNVADTVIQSNTNVDIKIYYPVF
jgi:effector-binding domain-containing protein